MILENLNLGRFRKIKFKTLRKIQNTLILIDEFKAYKLWTRGEKTCKKRGRFLNQDIFVYM